MLQKHSNPEDGLSALGTTLSAQAAFWINQILLLFQLVFGIMSALQGFKALILHSSYTACPILVHELVSNP
jgi:hypothetical protein